VIEACSPKSRRWHLSSSLGRGKRSWRLACAIAFVCLSVPIGLAGAQTASNPVSSFDASAAAYGFDSTLSNPSIPVGLVIQGAGPTAQTELSSLGVAQSFSAFPYPGDTVANLPGTVSGLFGGLPLPPYPLFVTSKSGQGKQSVSYPGIGLSADTSTVATNAAATVGTTASGFVSDASIRVDAGTVTATASTELRALLVGNVVQLSGVQSSAEAILQDDGTVKTRSAMTIGHINVPGLKITIPASTPTQAFLPIPIPGVPQLQPIPLPPVPLPLAGATITSPDIGLMDGQFFITLPFLGSSKFSLPQSAVVAAFKALGVDLTYQAAQVTAHSVVAPVLTVKTVLPSPPANQFYSGPTPVTVALGRTSASVQGAQTSGSGAATGNQPGDGGTIGASSPGDTAGSASGAGGGLGEAPGSGQVGGVPGTTSASPVLASPSSSASPALAAPALPRTVGAAVRTNPLGGLADIYLVIVGIGLVGGLAGAAIRYLGVRT
jgi:hypothetical protein